jgi:hypothetical protein
MTMYTSILFIHAVAVLVLTSCLTIETGILMQLRKAASHGEVRAWTSPVPRLGIAATSSLVIVYVTGAYLTESLNAWDFAWPRFAVLEIVLFAGFGALTGRRLRAIRRRSATTDSSESDLEDRRRNPFLKVSLSIRIWIVVGTTLLTAAKPGFVESLGIVLASLVLGIASGFVPFGRNGTASPATSVPANRTFSRR